jgi:hypothetical protein
MYFVLIILYEYFLVLERIIWVSIISYGEIRFDIRVPWITSTFPERIMLTNQGTTVPIIRWLKQVWNTCLDALTFKGVEYLFTMPFSDM